MGKMLDETKKFMKEIDEKRANEIGSVNGAIKDLKGNFEEAKLHKQLAMNACNIAEYKKAREEENDILLQLEMYENRKAAIESGRMIEEGDYKDRVENVRTEVHEIARTYSKRLDALYSEISVIAKEMHDMIDDADKTLQCLQHVYYKDGDRGHLTGIGYEKPKVFAALRGVREIAFEAERRSANAEKSMASQYAKAGIFSDEQMNHYPVER